MKVISNYTFRIGEGEGNKKVSREIEPGTPFDLPDNEAKDRIRRGLCQPYKAKQEKAESGGKKSGGKKPD